VRSSPPKHASARAGVRCAIASIVTDRDGQSEARATATAPPLPGITRTPTASTNAAVTRTWAADSPRVTDLPGGSPAPATVRRMRGAGKGRATRRVIALAGCTSAGVTAATGAPAATPTPTPPPPTRGPRTDSPDDGPTRDRASASPSLRWRGVVVAPGAFDDPASDGSRAAADRHVPLRRPRPSAWLSLRHGHLRAGARRPVRRVTGVGRGQPVAPGLERARRDRVRAGRIGDRRASRDGV